MTRRRLARAAVLGFATLALAIGAFTLTSPTAHAGLKPPLLCGPTLQWSCQKIGGPAQLFIGTVCEKSAFERKTGSTCKPL